MQTRLTFFCLFLSLATAYSKPFPFSSERVGGTYVQRRAYQVGLLNSPMDALNAFLFSDSPGDTRGKASLTKDIEAGRYSTDGPHVILLGDNPAFAEMFFHAVIDGVSVLINRTALYEIYYDGKLFDGDCLIHKADAKEDYGKWWERLIKEHPEFKRIIAR